MNTGSPVDCLVTGAAVGTLEDSPDPPRAPCAPFDNRPETPT